jgi:hypothetical protein
MRWLSRKKTSIVILVLVFLYVGFPIFVGSIARGHFTLDQLILDVPYSYDTMEEAKKSEMFVSNNLKVFIEGDSLKQIVNLNNFFYTCKDAYRKEYGYFISINHENKNYRMLGWEESLQTTSIRNWSIFKNGKYVGDAFYTGLLYEKIGDTVKLDIKNSKTDSKIGTIKILVE